MDLVGGPEGDDRVRVETGESGSCNLVLRRADHGQLARRGEVEVKRAEGVAERARRPWNRVADQPEDAGGLPLELVVPPDPPEAE